MLNRVFSVTFLAIGCELVGLSLVLAFGKDLQVAGDVETANPGVHERNLMVDVVFAPSQYAAVLGFDVDG